MDPPCYGSEGDYGRAAFSRDQFAEMAERLARIKGRFILSINDRPEVRTIFDAFKIEAVESTYSIASGKPMKAGEVIITSSEII